MSEIRVPDKIWLIRLPGNQGKKSDDYCKDNGSRKPKEKSRKIELYSAFQFLPNWEPASELFYPKIPLRTADRKIFLQTHYRIKVDGKWLESTRPGVKYWLLTKAEIFEKFF